MTIFVNTLPVNEKSSGIRTFLHELLLAFSESNNPAFHYRLICCANNKALFKDFVANEKFSFLEVNVDNSSPIKRIYFEQFKLNKLIQNQKDGLLLNICNIATFNCKLPQVIIIQKHVGIKALRKTLPKKYKHISLMHLVYYDLLLEKSIKAADKTIAISNYMVDFLGPYKDKIEIIHEGVNLETFNYDSIQSPSMYDFPYIFSISTLFPHKNMDRLIEAFAIFKKNNKNSLKLVIAGNDPSGGKLMDQLKEIARTLNVSEDVIFTGWVKNEDIPGLYKNASMFVFLSGMEFFGLPVLEAMACKVPVISSNKMSLPEVVNQGGILVEPDDVEGISKQMAELCTNKNLREELIQKGIENAKQFKWLTTAQKFEKVFEKLN